ncbi:hypothetical protein CYK59_03820 [Latilactobacillus curvatus]|uniref:hypothetical protein n=1 Tax=Latilactobacillus curvatus TaxID=28038 RepID=UPI000F7CF4CF|nr:hypothetical protein [Latilactobacillus curvatus]AZP96132.1 hypothetical protein CYK59_03820 [Latilactobacillus curvatus]
MNKHMYMAVAMSILLGLYIPKIMQFVVTIAVFSSMATYIGVNHREFFGTKKADSADDTDDSFRKADNE